MHVILPDLLIYLLSEIPKVHDLAYFSTKSEAGVQLLTKLRQKLLSNPKRESTEKLLDVAKPIASQMTSLQPILKDQLESFSTWQTTILMSIISFIGSMISHFVFTCVYHKCKRCQRYVPKRSMDLNLIESQENETCVDARSRSPSTGDVLPPDTMLAESA